MLPSLSTGPEKPSLLSVLKKALTQTSAPTPDGTDVKPSLSLKGLYSLVLGPKPSTGDEPHLLGQRPVLNQFQDPLSASLNRMRLILPVSDGGAGVTREPPSLTPPPKPSPLELPRDDRGKRHEQEQQQRVQEYQLAQMPLETHRRASASKDDLVLDSTGRPMMRRAHPDSIVERVARGITATLALTTNLVKALLALPLMILPLRLRLRLPVRRTTQTPRMRAPR